MRRTLWAAVSVPQSRWACRPPRGMAMLEDLGRFIARDTPESGFPKRIYISRNDARLRRVRNEDRLMSILAERGFQRVTLKGMPMAAASAGSSGKPRRSSERTGLVSRIRPGASPGPRSSSSFRGWAARAAGRRTPRPICGLSPCSVAHAWLLSRRAAGIAVRRLHDPGGFAAARARGRLDK